MTLFQLSLVSSIILCGLVAGTGFTFAVVAMPGLATLDDRGFIQGFQVMDRVIQNNQPLFLAVWAGSIPVLLTCAVLGYSHMAGIDRGLLVGATLLYLLGVQMPTMTVNVPLNNQLKQVSVEQADAGQLARARQAFEERWNRWNQLRTGAAVLTTLMLSILLLQARPL